MYIFGPTALILNTSAIHNTNKQLLDFEMSIVALVNLFLKSNRSKKKNNQANSAVLNTEIRKIVK